MGTYAEINGIRTWYDERGAGQPVVLLHGGLTDSRDFDGNLATLANRYRVLLLDRRGHGRTPDVEGPLDIETLTADGAAFVESVIGGPTTVVGYSAGAMVGLRLAVRRPDLVEKLVLISGAYHPDGMLLKPSLDSEPPAQLVEAYAQVSPDGPEHFPVLLRKVVRSVEDDTPLTAEEVGTLRCPTLVLASDDDIVTLEHTVALYRALDQGQLALVPGTSHLLLHEKPELCTRLVADFLVDHMSPTLLPLRRAGTVGAANRPPGFVR
jgi:pimeloyl-ACP methyl ester carboxylesterase